MKAKNFNISIFSILVLLGIVLNSCTDFEEEYKGKLVEYPEITITDFSPKSGRPSSPVTITGTNFGDYSDAAKILFNGVEVTDFVSYTDNEMVVSVPEDAGDGLITVQVWAHIKEFEESFDYIAGAKVVSIDKSRASAGDTVTITGENFGNDINAINISIGSTPVEVVSVSDTQVKFLVPDTESGSIIIEVQGQRIESIFLLVGDELVTGTLFGHSSSWGDNPATYISAAVDGDLSTFVDGPQAEGYVGYDVGRGNAVQLSSVRFAPRESHPQRIVGGEIRGANDPTLSDYVTLYTITEQPPVGQYSEARISTDETFQYIYFYSADGYCNIAEIEFYGNIVDAQTPIGKYIFEFTGGPREVKLDVYDDWVGRPDQSGWAGPTTTTVEDGYCKVTFASPSDGVNKNRADFTYSFGGDWGSAGSGIDKEPWVYSKEYPIYAIKVYFINEDGSLGGPRPENGNIFYDRLGQFNDDYAAYNVLWLDASEWGGDNNIKEEGSWWQIKVADILSKEKGYWIDWHRTFTSVEELEVFIGL